MDGEKTADTLRFVDDVGTSTRSHLQLFWFPLLVFGVVSLGAAVVEVIGTGFTVGLYWMVCGVVGGMLTSRHYERREDDLGLIRDAKPYLVIVALLAIGAFVLPIITFPGWPNAIWVGMCYLAFAWLERNIFVGWAAALMVALGVVFSIVDVSHEPAWISVATGLVLILCGYLAYRETLRI